MDVIRSRQILNREIKDTIMDCPEDKINFPKVIFYCERLGEPTLKITIEKIDEDFFIDGNGQKWMKVKES